MKGIPMKTWEVRAILDNRKTVTRRVVKPQPRMVYYDSVLQDSGDNVRDGVPLWVLIAEGQNGALEQIVPPYQPGSILYVRETWTQDGDVYRYKAGFYDQNRKWRPSIHMPREAARIFLRVTDVWVERLHDIDDGGVIAEGLEIGAPFDELWDSTIKKPDRSLHGWDANPWVWVIEFERISREEAQP